MQDYSYQFEIICQKSTHSNTNNFKANQMKDTVFIK